MAKSRRKEKFIIKFKISRHRKDFNTPSNYNGKLSPYWEKQFNDMFKGWD